MSDTTGNWQENLSLQQKSKEELIKMVLELQTNNLDWLTKYGKLRKSIKENEAKYEKELDFYKAQLDKAMLAIAKLEIKNEDYKKANDQKLDNGFKVNAFWIDKIIFVLKAADKPLRSSEIIEVLAKNDIFFNMQPDKRKYLSAHLTRALKYGKIIGEKHKGDNGYLYRLPMV